MTQEGGTPPGFWDRVQQMIDRGVAKAMRSGPLRNASISDGGLTIKGGFFKMLSKAVGGVVQFYLGPVTPSLPDGSPQQGWIVRRADGTSVLDLYDAFPDADGSLAQALTWRSRDGSGVIADDTDSGQGIARPYLPIVFYRARYTDWPQASTTGFEVLYRAKAPKQQPRTYVRVWGVNSDPAGTGEIQVTVNGTQLGSTLATVGGIINEFVVGPLPVIGAHMAALTIEVQARRVTGTGGVYVGMSQGEGRQS